MLTGTRLCRQGSNRYSLCGCRKPVQPFNLCSNTTGQASHGSGRGFPLPTATHALLCLSDSEALLGTLAPSRSHRGSSGFLGGRGEGSCPRWALDAQLPLSVRFLQRPEPSRLRRTEGAHSSTGHPSTLRDILILKLFAAYQKFKLDGRPLDRNSAAPSMAGAFSRGSQRTTSSAGPTNARHVY